MSRSVDAAKVAIQYDPSLMESVVTRALAAGGPAAAGFTSEAFHAQADPLYRVCDVGERSGRFHRLFADWFRRGGFDQPIAEALDEFADVGGAISRVTVTAAASPADERADLACFGDRAASAGDGKLWLGIAVQPGHFLKRPVLRRWLRHELWHVRDMLDPAFEYRREDLVGGSADRLPQRVVQDRYAVFWSLSIDARVQRGGFLPLWSDDERLARLAAAFPNASREALRAASDSLGLSRGLRHAELLDLARGPRKLFAGDEPSDGPARPLPGSPCPLCRFPTFHWTDLAAPNAEAVVQAIREAYPAWDLAQGVCLTCFDLFSIRAGVWV